jgi:hypothetical protein
MKVRPKVDGGGDLWQPIVGLEAVCQKYALTEQ